MCGIVAVFSPDAGVRPEPIKRATQALNHRGPDGEGLWISPDKKVGLGHARLSIIDLETGRQPIANEDDSIHVVVNGEFYDHDRIRGELAARGHQLSTSSDSEIAVHLYEDFGTGLMEDLRGEFAFILWDRRNQVLIAARDRFGIKPLYYAWHQGSLYLASEAKALFAAGVPAAWDRESFHQKIFTNLENDRSMFRGVRQVPPGHLMLTTAWGSKMVPYWDQNYPLESELQTGRSESEVVEQMHDQLVEATRLRMRADVPVGCYLSGGLDSCALLGIASTLHSRPIEAFTIAFEEEEFDEGPIAQEMAKKAGANFHPFLMSADLRADNFADAIWYSEDPHGNGNTVAKYLLSERVRDYGFKVVLTGEGSDEIYGGYPMFRQDMVRFHSAGSADAKDSDMQAIRERNQVASFMVGGDQQSDLAAAEGALGFTPSFLKAFVGRAGQFAPLLSEEFSREFEGRDPNRVFLNGIDLRALKGRQNISQSLYLWTKSLLPDILLNHLGDRMEMAHSIEGRTPFLDHHLVAAVNQMPIEMKIRGITEKYVLREAARPYITQTVYERQKHPFISPPATEGRFGQMLRDTLWSKALDDIPFFDAAAVRSTFDGLAKIDDPAQRQGLAFVLTSISSACILHDRFGL
jgi:asparagine synthase (glutamine-hydrolysing)